MECSWSWSQLQAAWNTCECALAKEKIMRRCHVWKSSKSDENKKTTDPRNSTYPKHRKREGHQAHPASGTKNVVSNKGENTDWRGAPGSRSAACLQNHQATTRNQKAVSLEVYNQQNTLQKRDPEGLVSGTALNEALCTRPEKCRWPSVLSHGRAGDPLDRKLNISTGIFFQC